MWYYHKVIFKREMLTRKGIRREYLRIYHKESGCVLASFPSDWKKSTYGRAFRAVIKFLPKLQRRLELQDRISWVEAKETKP